MGSRVEYFARDVKQSPERQRMESEFWDYFKRSKRGTRIATAHSRIECALAQSMNSSAKRSFLGKGNYFGEC